MDNICRLCCSSNFVNNDIFDEKNALYLKMSLYLPIKIIRDDRLPKRICDKCSCKVNDFYQFCNEAIEIQNRLTAALVGPENKREETIDLSVVKDNIDSPKELKTCEIGTQTEESPPTENSVPKLTIKIKTEPVTEENVKSEDDVDFGDGVPSDNSDDMSLIDLKQKKKKKKDYDSGSKHSKKKHKLDIKDNFNKIELQQWEDLMKVFPEGVTIKKVDREVPKMDIQVVKQEAPDIDEDFKIPLEELSANVKSEVVEESFECCVCFTHCYTRQEMLKHYRSHKRAPPSSSPPPAPPPPPSTGPLRCSRCQKVVAPEAWVSHWSGHVARDAKPYSCALCEKTFRDTHQILKHGQWHKNTEVGPDTPIAKRFFCDLCPQGFTYMRCLLAHRTRTHPEAAGRALSLRCGTCGDRFGHVNSLRRHLRQHAGDHHQCHICGKALSSREHLKFHVNIHMGYKPNVCKICGKGFVKKCNLTLHERVHTGEKPHVCSHCGKAFSQRSTLVIHERYHSGARPYVCSLCGRGFVAKGLLTLHQKTTCI